ncbi:MAG: sensor histidine kinase [Schleiferiaceae bacterium]|nr:sensor histidine kinase [Schleiferiaceae bacterium]
MRMMWVLLLMSFLTAAASESTQQHVTVVQNELRKHLENNQTDSVLVLTRQLLELGEATNDPLLTGEALFFQAYVETTIDTAIALYKSALVHFDTAVSWQFFTNRNIAALYEAKGYFLLALPHHHQALQSAKALQDHYWIALTYGDIAICYSSAEKFDEGVAYGLKGLTYIEAHPLREDDIGFLKSFLRNAVGINYDLAGAYDEALVYHLENYEANAIANPWFSINTICNNIGNTFSKMGDWASAASYIQRAYELVSDDPYSKSTVSLNMGRLAIENGDRNAAETYFTTALQQAELAGSYEKIRDAYEALSKFYERTNNPVQALHFARQYQTLRDSLLNESKLHSMAEMEALFQIQEKEADNLRLLNQNAFQDLQIQRQRSQLYLVIGGVVLLVVFLGWWWMRLRYQRKIADAETQKALERVRFSAVIETEDRERSRIARELHDGLGQVLSSAKLNVSALEADVPEEDRPILNNALELLDRSLQEVREISHNMMPATLSRLGLFPAIKDMVQKINQSQSQLQVVWECDAPSQDWPSPPVAQSLYRVLQEFVKNTLQHADATQLSIRYQQQNGHHIFQIKDNGKGFNTQSIAQSAGLGWANIQTRMNGIGAAFTINSVLGEGTFCEIVIEKE